MGVPIVNGLLVTVLSASFHSSNFFRLNFFYNAFIYGRWVCQNVDNAVVSFVGARFARPKTVCFVSSGFVYPGRHTGLPLRKTVG